MQKLPIAKKGASIKRVMREIDKGGIGVAFVVDEKESLFGLVTDGDVRRALLSGVGLDEPVDKIANRSPSKLPFGLLQQELVRLSQQGKFAQKIPKEGVMAIPLVDGKGRVKSVFFAHARRQTDGNAMIEAHKSPKRHQVIKKILVTGGAGYIGSVLVRQLLEKGYSVRSLDKFLYSSDSLNSVAGNPLLEIMRGDVLDIPTLLKAVKGVGAVVHLAEIVGDPASALDPEQTVANNIVAAVALAQVCKYFQVNRFVYASSCSVYGSADKDWVDESSPTLPVSLYARAKLEGEKGILALADENFSPTLLRFATVYGLSARMRFDLVVNVMAADALSKGEISVSGGSQWRPLCHVGDISRAIESALEKDLSVVGGQAFNVGSDGQNYRIVDLAKEIQSALAKRGRRVELKIAAENSDARSYRVSFKKIREKLGFKPIHSVESAVNEIASEFEKGRFRDYKDKKYSNFLSWKLEKGRLRHKISGAVSKILPKWLS